MLNGRVVVVVERVEANVILVLDLAAAAGVDKACANYLETGFRTRVIREFAVGSRGREEGMGLSAGGKSTCSSI